MAERRKVALAAATLALGLLGAALAAEALLRLRGHRPWTPLDVPAFGVRDTHPVLGWTNRPGRHLLPPFGGHGEPVPLSFLEDRSRATGAPAGVGPEVWLLGCSWTEGWGVADEASFAARLQQRFPALRFRNFASAGYGTYQSLLALEDLLGRRPAPALVLYGFIQLHEGRNVAAPSWLRVLSALGRTEARWPGLPYVSLRADGALVRHPPERYPAWPLREQLASVSFLQHVYAESRARRRLAAARSITTLLMIAMRESAQAKGAGFRVVMLHFGNDTGRTAYERFLERNRMRPIDCALPFPEELRVPNDGHPNAEMHARIARCIGDALEASERLVRGPEG